MASNRTTDLLLSLARYSLSLDHMNSWESFMLSNEDVFTSSPLPNKESSEYSLEFTEVHKEFEDLVQKQIGTFLEMEGVTMEEFGEMLVSASATPPTSSDSSSQASAFVQLLLGMVDFRAFVDIMRSRDKRKYYFQILNMWRSSLK
mmetsp:Transcript_5393/g.10770  ORF Transcript_5393/g.10770 Transcript_5393/m.10770 type:complete len:146 (+) Transcript_5393:142-579(+)